MDFRVMEQQINDYLDKFNLQITDPAQKQQDYFENVRHHIKSYEHKGQIEYEEMSPFSLREIRSPAFQVKHVKSDEIIRLRPHILHIHKKYIA